jgi:RNA polymerase sigma factor (sigma-70 family)
MIDENMGFYLTKQSNGRLLSGAEEIALAKQRERGQIELLDVLISYDRNISRRVKDDRALVNVLKKARAMKRADKHWTATEDALALAALLRESTTALLPLIARLGTAERFRRRKKERAELQSRVAGALQKMDEAKARLVEGNLRLVISIAKKYTSSSVPLSDLIQEGNLGLLKAVEKYDHRFECRFSTYATWWVRQTISRSGPTSGQCIRVPFHILDKNRRIAKARRSIAREKGTEASPAEVARETAIPVDKMKRVEAALRLCRPPTSLDLPSGEGEGVKIGDRIADDEALSPLDAAMAGQTAKRLELLLKQLGPKEEKLVRLRYGIGERDALSLTEVGRRFGFSREWARQLESKALKQMRRHLLDEDIAV